MCCSPRCWYTVNRMGALWLQKQRAALWLVTGWSPQRWLSVMVTTLTTGKSCTKPILHVLLKKNNLVWKNTTWWFNRPKLFYCLLTKHMIWQWNQHGYHGLTGTAVINYIGFEKCKDKTSIYDSEMISVSLMVNISSQLILKNCWFLCTSVKYFKALNRTIACSVQCRHLRRNSNTVTFYLAYAKLHQC